MKSKRQIWLERELRKEKKKNAYNSRLAILNNNKNFSVIANGYRDDLIDHATRAERYFLSALLKKRV